MRAGPPLLYASTLGAIGLGAASVLARPVPLPVVGAASLLLGGVVLAGVFEPRLSMFADVVGHGPPRPEAPRVALTFDDGPSLDGTPRILDALDAAACKATFFVVGRKLDAARGAIARDARSRGHSIGCHSFAHDRLFAMRGSARVRDDLQRALVAIEDATGAPTRLFRPPIGHTNPIIARVAEELGLSMIGFSVRAYDGLRGATAAGVARRVIAGLRDGAIVLMHDGAERDDRAVVAVEALGPIVAAMAGRRLAGVDLEEMLTGR